MLQVDALQAVTAGKYILGQNGDAGGQGHIGHLLTVREGILADLGHIGKICSENVGSEVGVLILGLAVHHFNSGNGHIFIQALIVNVTGECVITDGDGLIEVNIPQAVTVIEGHVADLCIFT